MRYADGPSVTCAVHVDADPRRVWEFVSDIELPARLSPELQRVEWLSDDGLTLGATFAGYNRHPVLGDWRTISHVVEFDDGHAFSWVVVDPDVRFGGGPPDSSEPMATWRFQVEPEEGGARLSQSVRIGPARSGISLAIDRRPDDEEALVAHRLDELRAGIDATLAGIKTLAEAGGAASTSHS